MPNYSGILEDLGLGAKKAFSNPEADEAAAQRLSEYVNPLTVEEKAEQAAQGVLAGTTGEVTQPSIPKPQTPSPTPSNDQILSGLGQPSVQEKPNFVLGDSSGPTPLSSETAMVPRGEQNPITAPNFQLGEGSEAKYVGPNKPEPQLPVPFSPKTNDEVMEVLKTKSPEERAAWYQKLKDNPGKALAALGVAGMVGANLSGGKPSVPGGKLPATKAVNKSSEEEPDDTDEEETPEHRTSSAAKLASQGVNVEKPAMNKLQGLADMITPQTQDYQGMLKQAQGQRDAQTLIANMGKAGAQIASGMGRTAMPSTEVYDNMIKQADNSLKDFDARMAVEKKDPNSEYSKGLQKFLKSMYGIDTNASAEAISGTMLKPIETMYENQQKAKAHTEDIKLKAQELGVLKAQKLQNDQEKQQNSATAKTTALLESARGSPAVGQAEKDLYAISKINSMVNLYGDPNKLNPAQVQLLATEIGKIAQGGVPTAAELKGLNPSTLPSKTAELAQKVVNEPVPANLGAFVKSMKDYADSLNGDARKIIKDKYGRVLESSKKQIGDDNYNILKAQYMGRFPDEEAPHQGKYPPGSTVQIKGKQYKVGADGDTLTAVRQ